MFSTHFFNLKEVINLFQRKTIPGKATGNHKTYNCFNKNKILKKYFLIFLKASEKLLSESLLMFMTHVIFYLYTKTINYDLYDQTWILYENILIFIT